MKKSESYKIYYFINSSIKLFKNKRKTLEEKNISEQLGMTNVMSICKSNIQFPNEKKIIQKHKDNKSRNILTSLFRGFKKNLRMIIVRVKSFLKSKKKGVKKQNYYQIDSKKSVKKYDNNYSTILYRI
jgi:hypothetical protein